jgi:prepilin-type N-terminal cleavage/methylation domain-containing protein/prepilin-type processing-associated H-X9-DG protein
MIAKRGNPGEFIRPSRVFPNHSRSAFTLIELLVVVAIISLLVSILLPSLAKAKEHGRTVVCLSLVRNMASANQMYANDASGSYAPIIMYDLPAQQAAHWMWNPMFRELAGAGGYYYDWAYGADPNAWWPRSRWPAELACPNASLGPALASIAGQVYIPVCFGFNTDGRHMNWGTSRPVAFTAEEIPNPTQKIQSADAVAFWMHRDHSNRYVSPLGFVETNVEVYGWGPIAYRHLQRANIQFFDGHAEPVWYEDVVYNNDMWNALE